MTLTDTPPGRYRIGEIARISGFTPTALRYYEQAGVLAPPDRTSSGYRTYTDRDLDRLRLITRAKDLGCTLDEIADLVRAWDDDECGPVKHRLRALVDAKVRAVQDHLAEQAAFAAQLQATAAALAARPLDGPCDHGCGCTTITDATNDADGATHAPGAPAPAPVLLGRRSTEADASEPPIACSLAGDERGHRLEEWQAVLDHVTERSPIAGGVRLVLDPTASVVEAARLAAAEQTCCPFFAFALTIDGQGMTLAVTAPTDGQDLLATVFGVPA